MHSIADYTNPFDAIKDFETALSRYTGAPYVITTDCCTHAIEIALRITKPNCALSFPSRTYLSVLMTMHKLDIQYHLNDRRWYQDLEYQFEGSNIWDSARKLESNMYRPGQIQCLSFGRTKPLEIGKGGCILTDDPELATKARRMRYDGREIDVYKPWSDQGVFELGFHYYLRPEDAVNGHNLLSAGNLLPQQETFFNYPDCSQLTITS